LKNDWRFARFADGSSFSVVYAIVRFSRVEILVWWLCEGQGSPPPRSLRNAAFGAELPKKTPLNAEWDDVLCE